MPFNHSFDKQLSDNFVHHLDRQFYIGLINNSVLATSNPCNYFNEWIKFMNWQVIKLK